MEAVILLGSHNQPEHARELLTAGRSAGADQFELIQFGGDPKGFSHIPVNRMTVFHGQGPYLPEDASRAASSLLKERDALILCYGDFWGHTVSVRLSFLLGRTPIPQVTAIRGAANGIVMRRRIYGLRIEGDFSAPAQSCVLSIQSDSFFPHPGNAAPVLCEGEAPAASTWYHELWSAPYSPEGSLCNSRVVLIGGRGLGCQANAKKLCQLAQRMGAGIGATRPAVQNGWFPENCLVGASGTQIAPEVCVTFGVSGCAALMLGIERSQIIWSINTDPDAPIFSACTEGTIADCQEVIEALMERYQGE